MNIGVINESNKIENRAGLSPSGISFLVEKGHTVFVQAGTGLKSGYTNEEYSSLGADIVFTKEEAFGRSDIVLNISPLDEEESKLVKKLVLRYAKNTTPSGVVKGIKNRRQIQDLTSTVR